MEPEWIEALEIAGISTIEDILALEPGALGAVEGIDEAAALAIQSIVDENVEVIEEGESEAEEGEELATDEEYQCPDCGARVTPEMSHCPSCGVELSFEYEDGEEA
jgi:N utilization substance protein A